MLGDSEEIKTASTTSDEAFDLGLKERDSDGMTRIAEDDKSESLSGQNRCNSFMDQSCLIPTTLLIITTN
jgi:hypothetical protein